MKKILFILSVVCCLAGCCNNHELVILHTNDTHSHIEPARGGVADGLGGVIERSVYIDSVRNAAGKDNVLLLDAGDFSQGTSYFPMFNGDLEVNLMNAMGYDVSALGNHEFDNGIEELARRLGNAAFDVVCANYDFTGLALENCVKPCTSVMRAGRKIGIIGLLADLSDVVDSKIAADLKYIEPSGLTTEYAAQLRSEGCDLIIVLSHLGYEEDCDLVTKISGVDLVIGGHSHTFLAEPTIVTDASGKEVMVVTDGCWGINVGQLKIK